MYKQCITERSAKQQQSIESAFLDLIHSKPYHSVTVSDVCEKAGISRFTFYRIFDCKDDVLDAIVDKVLLQWMQVQPSRIVTEENMYDQNCAFFAFWAQQKSLLQALCDSGKTSLIVERSIQFLTKEDHTVVQYFGAHKSEHGEEIFRFCASGVFSLVIDWHQSGYQKSIEQMAQILEFLLQKLTIFS